MTRDKSYILSHLQEKEDIVVALDDISLQFPVRYVNRELATVGVTNKVFGCFAIVKDSKYAVANFNAIMETEPHDVETILIDEVEYYQFKYIKGDLFIKNRNVVKLDTIIYNVIDEFIFSGNVPWFMSYNDMGSLLSTAKEFADSNVSNNEEILELIVSILARDKNDRKRYLKEIIKSYNDTTVDKLTYVPFKSVFYSVHNTTSRITGNYFSDALVASIVDPSSQTNKIEDILRA